MVAVCWGQKRVCLGSSTFEVQRPVLVMAWHWLQMWGYRLLATAVLHTGYQAKGGGGGNMLKIR